MNLKTVFYDWYGWNTWLFELLNAGLPEAARPLAYIGSALGNYWAAPIMVVALALWARHAQVTGFGLSPVKIRLQAYRFGWACLLALVLTGLLKWGLDFARPGTALGHSVRILAPVERSHGFPSGHSVYAALVLGALWPLASRPVRGALLFMLLWVGYARVAMGAHFPADVMAGWLVGAVCLLAVGAASSLPTPRVPTAAPRAFAHQPGNTAKNNRANEVY